MTEPKVHVSATGAPRVDAMEKADPIGPSMIGAITTSQNYFALLENLRAMGVERQYRVSMELIEWKYEQGEAIVQSNLYAPHAYGQGLMAKLSQDMGIQKRRLYEVLRFYFVAQDEGGLEGYLERHSLGKNITWAKVLSTLGKKELPAWSGEEVEGALGLEASVSGEEPAEAGPVPMRQVRHYKHAHARALRLSKRMVGHTWTEEANNFLEMMLIEEYDEVEQEVPSDNQGEAEVEADPRIQPPPSP